jgi:hypothetical protein
VHGRHHPARKLPLVLRRMRELSEKYGLRVANVFHAGDGNLHPLILLTPTSRASCTGAEDFGADILRLCVEVGGVLTGEHGVGVEKRDLMPCMFNEIDLDQQHARQMRLRRPGLLNPGKVFPQLHRCAELGRMHVVAEQAGLPRHSAVLIDDWYDQAARRRRRSCAGSGMGAGRGRAARDRRARAASARSASRCSVAQVLDLSGLSASSTMRRRN